MPVIRPLGRREPLATLRDHLADLLVKELMGGHSRMGPVIFELPTDRADRVDVIVVWEAWKDLSPEDRSEIVREAYSRFAKILEPEVRSVDPDKPHEPLTPTPASVTAVSWEDLTEIDLLPFKVQPTATGKEIDLDDARLLMIEAGAIQTSFGPQLRFPNKEMAADAYARLMKEMPEARWTIVESTFGPIMD